MAVPRPSLPPGPSFAADVSEIERRRWLNVLANLPIFDRAAGATVEGLLAEAMFRRHAAGETVYREGEAAANAHFLIEGTVRVYQVGRTSDVQYTPKIFRAPTHFGDLAGLARLGV